MGRKKKIQPPEPQPDESASVSLENPNPEIAEEEVETHEAPKGGGFNFSNIMERARDNLSSSPEPAKSARKPYVKQKQKDEVTTLVSSMLTLALASWKVPDTLKPNDDEMNALSVYSTQLLLRHVDLSGRMTADVLDMIGILAVASGWYARTAPAWREYRDLQQATRVDVAPVSVPSVFPANKTTSRNPTQRIEDNRADPIRNIDPGAADFLDRPRGGNND